MEKTLSILLCGSLLIVLPMMGTAFSILGGLLVGGGLFILDRKAGEPRRGQ